MTTKQRVIMHRSHAINADPGKEFFWEKRDDFGLPRLARGLPRLVSLNRGDWADMGSPEVVTVTIEPGDLLNDDPISQ